jgi:hypothetical protein
LATTTIFLLRVTAGAGGRFVGVPAIMYKSAPFFTATRKVLQHKAESDNK